MTRPTDPTEGVILDATGFPVCTQITVFKVLTVHPPGEMPWVCLVLRAEAPGSLAAAAPTGPGRAPLQAQFAMPAALAHRLGLDLIRSAARAVAPE